MISVKKWQAALALLSWLALLALLSFYWRKASEQTVLVEEYRQIRAEKDSLDAQARIADAAVETLQSIANSMELMNEKLDRLGEGKENN